MKNCTLDQKALLNKTLFTCQTTASFSTVLGNINYVVKDFIFSQFPKGYLKGFFLDTTQLSNVFNSIDENLKKDRPFLIIRPKYSLSPDTLFSDQLPEWQESATYLFQDLDGFNPIFADKKNDLYIYGITNRFRITLDMEYVCETLMEQYDLGTYLVGSIKHKRPFYLRNMPLEYTLPKNFVQMLASINHFDLSDSAQKAQFRTYLDTYGQRMITEKITTSNGRPNYFYSEPINLLCNFEDYPNMDDGEEKGQTKSNFKISDSLSVEFWAPINYLMIAESKLVNGLDNALVDKNTNEVESTMNGIYHAAAFNYDLSPEYLSDGKESIAKVQYIIDNEEEFVDGMDVVQFYDIIPFRYKPVLVYIKRHHLDWSKYFEVRVYGNSEKQRLDLTQVKIDWDTMTMYNKYPRVGGTYTFIVYAKMELCNKILRHINHQLGLATPYNDHVVDNLPEIKDPTHDEHYHPDESANNIEGNANLETLTKEEADAAIKSNYNYIHGDPFKQP